MSTYGVFSRFPHEVFFSFLNYSHSWFLSSPSIWKQSWQDNMVWPSMKRILYNKERCPRTVEQFSYWLQQETDKSTQLLPVKVSPFCCAPRPYRRTKQCYKRAALRTRLRLQADPSVSGILQARRVKKGKKKPTNGRTLCCSQVCSN